MKIFGVTGIINDVPNKGEKTILRILSARTVSYLKLNGIKINDPKIVKYFMITKLLTFKNSFLKFSD